MDKRYRVSANYTIEAAFIVPMILGIIFAMIYMLFFLHDKVILQENIRYSVICLAEGGESSKEDDKKISKSDISKNLRVFNITNVKCDIGKIYIKVEVKAVSKIDIPVVGYFMKRTKKICLKTKYLKIKPDVMVRYRQKSGE